MKIYQSFVLSLIVGTAMTAPAVAAASSGATTLDTTAVTAPAGVPESAMPQGTIKYYVTDTHEYEIAYGGSDYSQMYLHSTCVVYGADGKVYIKGVDRYDMQNQCFVEGRLEGNKIIVPLPRNTMMTVNVLKNI